MTIWVAPWREPDVISVTAAIVPRRRSKGVATEEAMVSGLAPGRPALTAMVGRSICGNGATGRSRKAAIPASMMPMVSSTVAIGRRMKGAEMFTRAAT